ncbi:hypothetical protein C2S51_038293 [Perilla frutescens var. frutescens]|nr:hypothetical protein C2S51_038293 [Perilla frutescens var. frutescens]
MMICSNPTPSAMLFLFFLSIASFKLSYAIGINTVFCPEIEKQSLLRFKKSLKDPYKLLSSWDDEVTCCKWNGVICNNLTGHVHQLHLQGSFSDQFPFTVQGLSGKLNPSLLNLKHLKYLDLSLNSFAETIPSFIGSFAELQYLNLSYAGFNGKIPHDIGNLACLHTLVFGPLSMASFMETDMFLSYTSQLVVDNLEWLSGLSELEYLNMNNANLSRATDWAQVINTLPSLKELHLSSCSLESISPPNDVNTTSLAFIDLSKNNIQSFVLLRWILQLSGLVFLDLSNNHLEGPIPTFCNATNLQHVDLSYNEFNSSIPYWLYISKDLEFVALNHNDLSGTISNSVANLTSLDFFSLRWNQLSGKLPKEIANLCKIQLLDIVGNKLEGDISDLFGNMSKCFLGALQVLWLSGNQLSGHLTDQFGEFKSLEDVELAFNSLVGEIPQSLGKLTSLRTLNLKYNKFSGNLPESLGQLYNLFDLNIEHNMLEGVVTESHFANLTKLTVFSASENPLTLNVSPNWIPPFQLETLELRSWNLAGIGTESLSWLENQNNIGVVDLSNTGISFNVPSWFWGIPILNVSHNYLHGKILHLDGATQLLYMSSNQFSGLLPRVGGAVSELDLSNNSFSGGMSHFLCDMEFETYSLSLLHLGGNQLSGELPDCWLKWPSLRYLNLGNNNLSGSIPHSIGYLGNLQSLNLYNNKISGQIPFSLQNCTALKKIELAGNDLEGSIPVWVGTSLIHLRILILRSNKLSGNISSEICCLSFLQILDLSSNKISGIIPRCVYNFTAMATKGSLVDDNGFRQWSGYDSFEGRFIESASVATKGGMLQYDTILPLVTNIDLSKNNLSGDLPKELTSLVELRSLNLSENQLNGVIPDNIGDMRQLECLDLSVNLLSGQIPNSVKLLSSLAYLNLSFNKLTGEIPESTQISGFNALSFIGNNLCGPPLRRNCSHDDGERREETEGDKPEIEWLYVLLCLGFAVGFSGVCTTLVMMKSWREAYFGLLEFIWDKAYVYVYIKWRRLTKPSALNS